jgi:hypothetical protein
MYERRNIENVIKEEKLEKVRKKESYRGSKKGETYIYMHKLRKGNHIESKKGRSIQGKKERRNTKAR